MARISALRYYRARLTAFRPSARQLGVLLVLDVIETAASGALAVLSPLPAAPVRVPYPVLDAPSAPAGVSASVAMLGLAVGLLTGGSLVYELFVLYQRSRYAFAITRRRLAKK